MAPGSGFSEVAFAPWYRAVSINDGKHDQRLAARFSAISSFVSKMVGADIEPLIGAALGISPGDGNPTLTRLVQAFQAADDEFGTTANDRERQILAASTLAAAMETGRAVSAQAALAITTSLLAGARQTNLPVDIAGLGEASLARHSKTMRERPRMGQEPSPSTLSAEIAKLKEAPTFDAVVQTFTTLQQELDQTNERRRKMLSSVETILRMQDEELDMLWWLVGRHSYDLNCAFDDVPDDQKPMVFAKELADRSRLPSSPPALLALFTRAGMKSSEIALTDQINAAPDGWVKQAVNFGAISRIVTPMHFALQRRLETGAGTAWVPPFLSVTGIPEGFSQTRTTLATLFYRERVLLSMMA